MSGKAYERLRHVEADAFTVRGGGNVCCIMTDPAGFSFAFGDDRILAFNAAAAAFVDEFGREPEKGNGHAHFVGRPRLKGAS